MGSITIIKGDITKAEVDAVVNAANPVMLGGGGVDGAIHNAAGPLLLEECKKVKAVDGVRCPSGEAVITGGYNLKAKYVIHTVGPRYTIDQHPQKLLKSAYSNSLNLAVDHQCQSIAFPAISCGVYGYPADEAADISLSVCKKAVYSDLDITFYLFSDELVEIWTEAVKKV